MSEETKPTPPAEAPKDNLVITHHTVQIGGQSIAYTVTTGTIVLKEESVKKGDKGEESEGEKPRASIFFTAYTRDDTTDPATRPLTFAFNGGPGSSSVWLHLGVLGPKRVLMDDEGRMLPPPFRLTENNFSLLDVTDLVFIDPVSTGYSRVVTGEADKPFLGFKKDIESVGDFIRLYTTRYQRWLSPKFLIGESYGTLRSAGLSGYLQDRHGMYLNGIMLVSSVLEFQTLNAHPGNDLPYILFLPTYTATAWYHKRLSADLQARPLEELLEEVERFALDEYTRLLMYGASAPAAEVDAAASKLSRYTGLSETYIRQTNLRIDIHRFDKELLRSEGLTTGRLDSRFTGMDRDAAGETNEDDPSMTAILGPYTAAFNDYVRRDLGFESDLPYEILNFQVFPRWSYAEHQNKYVNVSETLRRAMTINPYLKVIVANGYYDLATPYFATEYTFNNLGLAASLRNNLRMTYYPAGHMMYIHMPSLEQLKADLAEFIAWAVPAA